MSALASASQNCERTSKNITELVRIIGDTYLDIYELENSEEHAQIVLIVG